MSDRLEIRKSSLIGSPRTKVFELSLKTIIWKMPEDTKVYRIYFLNFIIYHQTTERILLRKNDSLIYWGFKAYFDCLETCDASSTDSARGWLDKAWKKIFSCWDPESFHTFQGMVRNTYHKDLEKRGEIWCGGARETREPHVTIGWLLPADNIFSNFPAFQDLYDMSLYEKFKFHCFYSTMEYQTIFVENKKKTKVIKVWQLFSENWARCEAGQKQSFWMERFFSRPFWRKLLYMGCVSKRLINFIYIILLKIKISNTLFNSKR